MLGIRRLLLGRVARLWLHVHLTTRGHLLRVAGGRVLTIHRLRRGVVTMWLLGVRGGRRVLLRGVGVVPHGHGGVRLVGHGHCGLSGIGKGTRST